MLLSHLYLKEEKTYLEFPGICFTNTKCILQLMFGVAEADNNTHTYTINRPVLSHMGGSLTLSYHPIQIDNNFDFNNEPFVLCLHQSLMPFQLFSHTGL